MPATTRTVVVVGGGTSGSVIASRLSEDPEVSVVLLEAGADDDTYDEAILQPANAAGGWQAAPPMVATPMAANTGDILGLQGRILGGTSAVNGMATLRGLPEDYDEWASRELSGWSWSDVLDTFVAAERDQDLGPSAIHGDRGPLPVRRWRRDELSEAPRAFHDGMVEIGESVVADVNDPTELPGIGVFPVTIDDRGQRVSTSLAYLTPDVRARQNLEVRTHAEVDRIRIDRGRAVGVTLVDGTDIAGDEIVVCAGALWTPTVLMRSGIGPAEHLGELGIRVESDLPVGKTMSDHLGPGLLYQHPGDRGGDAGPAQVVLVGASNGSDVDYHAFPVVPPPGPDDTVFLLAVFLLRSSGRGRVRLAGDLAQPMVTAPPMPDDAGPRLRHGFDRLVRWERSAAFAELGAHQVSPLDLAAPDAVDQALERLTVSYGHMVGTCPMGPVLDADCRVLGIDGLRVADASVMPTIPSGNTYLGCVMVAERIAQKMAADRP